MKLVKTKKIISIMCAMLMTTVIFQAVSAGAVSVDNGMHVDIFVDENGYQHKIWIEKVQIRTKTKVDLQAMLDGDDPLADILKNVQKLSTADDSELERFTELFQTLKAHLPAEYFTQEESIDFGNPAALRPVFKKLEQFLIPKLIGSSS